MLGSAKSCVQLDVLPNASMLELSSCIRAAASRATATLQTARKLRYQEVPDFFGVPFGGEKRQSDLPFFYGRTCRVD